MALFVLGLVASENWRAKRTVTLIVVTIFYTWSGTRGALLAATMSATGWIVQGIRSTFVGNMLKILFGLMAILTLAIASIDKVLEFLPEQVIRFESLAGGGGRLVAWEHAVDQIMANPWFGAGGCGGKIF